MTCPFTGDRLALIPALNPDVAIVHVQRVDEDGNTHFWGGSGVTKEAVLAAGRVIVVAEELVGKSVIRRDPNRTLIPGFLIRAIVIEPWGAHPSPVQGYYNRDHNRYVDYHHQTKKRGGYLDWLRKWVYGMKDRKAYLQCLGRETLPSLAVKRRRKAAAVDYGY
jgi:glutaconate CoA-transferase subunit A